MLLFVVVYSRHRSVGQHCHSRAPSHPARCCERGIVESVGLEKTFEVIESNHNIQRWSENPGRFAPIFGILSLTAVLRIGWVDALGAGEEVLAWWSGFGNPTGWLSVNTFESLALRHRLFSID